jgi:hypothetical protein
MWLAPRNLCLPPCSPFFGRVTEVDFEPEACHAVNLLHKEDSMVRIPVLCPHCQSSLAHHGQRTLSADAAWVKSVGSGSHTPTESAGHDRGM